MARILIIEDNAANLELMAYLLCAFGHATRSACSGQDGIAEAVRDPPDLVICDVQMPFVDGYEVARRLKAEPRTARLPIVAVTALAMVGDRDRGLIAGFDGYIPKPIDPAKFVQQIETFVAAEKHGTLPRPTAEAAPQQSAEPRPKHSKILVVDDSAINRELLRHVLDSFGYEVWSAASVTEARAILRERIPDLLLTDIHLADGNGFDLVRRVQADARLGGVRCICISSSGWGGEGQATAIKLGVKFIVRPIEPEVLLREIADCVDSGR